MQDGLRVSERQLRTSLEERERLARDLHDGVVQSVYALGLNIEDCARTVLSDPAKAEQRLRKVVEDLNRVLRELRNVSKGLQRRLLKADELKATLQALALAATESQSARINIQFDDAATARLSAAEATELLQIAREALSNAVRHARAKNITLQLRRSDHGICFEVVDDGAGFNPVTCEGKGSGLRNMAARARDMKAAFELVSQIGEGTRIVLDITQQSQEQSLGENPPPHR